MILNFVRLYNTPFPLLFLTLPATHKEFSPCYKTSITHTTHISCIRVANVIRSICNLSWNLNKFSISIHQQMIHCTLQFSAWFVTGFYSFCWWAICWGQIGVNMHTINSLAVSKLKTYTHQPTGGRRHIKCIIIPYIHTLKT